MMEFDYFYGSEADQFNFIRIPKALLTDAKFRDLTLQAKMLYGLLLDRMGLSLANHWVDSDNKVYIIYQISEIMENLGLSKNRAMSYLSELENFGLVEKKKRGHGLPNLLYIKNFVVHEKSENTTSEEDETMPKDEEIRGEENLTSENEEKSEIHDSMKSEKPTCEVAKSGLLYSKTECNKTEEKETDLILSETGYDEVLDSVLEQIEYNTLVDANPMDIAMIDSLSQVITEVMLNRSPEMMIGGNTYPTEMVKKRFESLDSSHIEYVVECLHRSTKKMRNMKKYMLAMLFNAPLTIDAYYTNLVANDMKEGA